MTNPSADIPGFHAVIMSCDSPVSVSVRIVKENNNRKIHGTIRIEDQTKNKKLGKVLKENVKI